MPNFHIYGKTEKITDLPFYIFEYHDTIAVKKLIIEWDSKKTEACGMILTDLIEKDSQNQKQQLCTFVKSPTSNITEVDFTNPVFYKLQTPYMHCSSLTIQSMFGEELPEIKNVFLQLISK